MLNLLSARASRAITPLFSLIHTPRRSFYNYKIDDPKIPEYPEKSLFSSLINVAFTPEQAKKLEEEYALKFDNQNKTTELRPFKKSKEFELTRTDYSKITEQNPVGKVNVFNYKDTKFTLVGPQYEFVPIKNIYKILSFSKPSIIVIQARPDQILKSINTNPLNESNKFSSSKYFAQLLHKATTLMPSNKLRTKVYDELIQNGILVNDNSENALVKYKPFNVNERVSMEAIATACLYAEDKGIDIVIGDVPESVYRQNIANSHTLMQLQNIFSHCSRELAYYPDLRPQTPFTMACLLYPEIFVKPSDKYMSTLFEYMIHKGHKNILGLLGYNQSESLVEYLDKRKVSHLEDELKVTPMMKSIVRDIQGEEILEKHALLDVLFHGDNVIKNMQDINFKTTYEIIRRHADPQFVDSSKPDQFRVLHYQFLVKYHANYESEFAKGKKTLSREFLLKMKV